MTHVRGQLLASVAGLVLVGGMSTASADQLLTGSIASASGQKLEGVLISAKREGSTITTSVYTDQNGEYFFPAMADGKYQVWAQTLGFQTAKGAVAPWRFAQSAVKAAAAAPCVCNIAVARSNAGTAFSPPCTCAYNRSACSASP